MSDNVPKGALTNPFALSTDDGYTWLKGNLHSHTTNSDGKAAPQERLDGYVGQGYDFLCLSDHHKITFTDTVQAPSDFVLIQGAELHPDNPFGGQRHHFVCLNIPRKHGRGEDAAPARHRRGPPPRRCCLAGSSPLEFGQHPARRGAAHRVRRH